MGTIYEWTFFLALGLLAIVIMVFVFAVSLLGRALEAAAREQEKTTKEQKEAVEIKIAAIQKQISALEKKGRIDKEKLKDLETELKQLVKEDERFGKKLGRIGKAPEPLTVKCGVVFPGVSLLVALILSGVAWYFWYLFTLQFSTIQIFIWMFWIEPLSVFIWIASLLAILYGIFRIYKSLKAVERVAITSEAEAERRLAAAVKLALKELEEEKKLQLKMRFEGAQPPFQIKAKSEMLIKISVGIVKGDVARNVEVAFWAPTGFKFPGSPRSLPSEKYTNCVSNRISLGDIMRPTSTAPSIKLKVPSQPGSYTMAYRLFCEGFDSGYEEFEVVVK